MEPEETPQPEQPVTPPAFNGWAVYGCAWVFAAVRFLHALIGEKDQEIVRLRTENCALRDRLLARASVAPIGDATGPPPVPGSLLPGPRRELKPPIAMRNATVRAAEDRAVRGVRAAQPQNQRRERIREDIAASSST